MTSPTTPPTVEPSAGARAPGVAFTRARREPLAYLFRWLTGVAFYAQPIPAGLLLKAVLDRVVEDDASPVVGLLVALAAVEIGRWLLLAFAVVQWHGCWVFWHTLLRVNMLRSLLRAPGPAAGRLPSSSGEAVSRFRDDTMHLSIDRKSTRLTSSH